MTKKQDDALYLVKIQLKGAKPPIWRRMAVPRTIILEQFDKIVQETMGWAGYHLSAFEIDDNGYKQYKKYDEDDDFWDEDCFDYSEYRLCDVLHLGRKSIDYTYDFGDNWEHKITLEDDNYQPPKPLPQPVWCIKGKNDCPLEDSGGIWGYMDLLEVLKNPDDEEYQDAVEWLESLGYESVEEFDPTEFDIDYVNEMLEIIWEKMKNTKKEPKKHKKPVEHSNPEQLQELKALLKKIIKEGK